MFPSFLFCFVRNYFLYDWMKRILLSTCVLVGLVACNEKILMPGGDEQTSKIRFRAGGPAVSASVYTKAAVVTGVDLDADGFIVNAVKGIVGADTEVWTNQEFTKVGDVWEQDKWWPNDDQSYRFYAVYPKSYTTTFAAGGPTISASNEHDIICAYAGMEDVIYKEATDLCFEHIFARLTDVTVTAVAPYTVSDISIVMTPLVSGTYDIRAGAGRTDGTGWSNTVAVDAPVSIAASTPGTKSNDIYLVPGSYSLTASWIVTRDEYTQVFENITVNVNLVAGKKNVISARVAGDAFFINASVSVSSWAVSSPCVEPF